MGSPVQSFDPLTGDSAPRQSPGRSRGQRSDAKTLGLIALATFVLLALIGLASAVDLSALRSPDTDQTSDGPVDAGANAGSSNSPGSSSGGQQGAGAPPIDNSAPFGDGQPGRIDLGQGADGAELEVRPIPWCPDGFRIGDDILVIPDPEACGLQRVPPGTQGFESGMRILVPDAGGDVGGFRIGPDGEIGLVAPGDLRSDDIIVGQRPDGSFELRRPDGSRVEIAPGDNGLDLRDPNNGNAFVPNPNAGSNAPGPAAPGLQDPSDQANEAPSASSDGGDENDFSGLGAFLLVVVIAALLGLLAFGLRNVLRARSDTELDDGLAQVQDSLDEPVDYSTEINALDRLLWEIDQEADPRTAIRRVYAALETGLDNPAMARRRSETPGIYLRRVLGHFDELATPLQELTLLFEQARFSDHEITMDMRNRAVESLLAVRSHYASQSSIVTADDEIVRV